MSRWAALLAVAAQRAYASSLLELPLAREGNGECLAPEPHELLADNRWEHPVLASRLPPPAQVSGWPHSLLGEQERCTCQWKKVRGKNNKKKGYRFERGKGYLRPQYFGSNSQCLETGSVSQRTSSKCLCDVQGACWLWSKSGLVSEVSVRVPAVSVQSFLGVSVFGGPRMTLYP